MKRQSISVTISVALLFVLAATPAAAALPFNVKITGETQGLIQGSVTQAGREGTIQGLEYHHLVEIPVDAASGAPAGRPVHQVVIFTKAVDRSTVNLWRAFGDGENLTKVEFMFYRLNPVGTEELYYKVTLTDAKVVALEPITPHVRDAEFENFPDQERIRLDYRLIKVEFPSDGGEEHELSSVDPGA